MKILELTGEPIGSGGQEMFIINVLRNINLTDMTIDWLTPYFCENELYKKDVEEKGGNVYALNLPFNPGQSRFNLYSPVLKFLKENKYDVVHIHSGSISVLAICSFACRIAGVKNIVVHSHSTGTKKDIKYRVLKALMSIPLRFCPTSYCACSVEAGLWKFPEDIVSSKMHVVNNGIDLSKFRYDGEIRKKIRQQFTIDDNTIVLGHVGRFSHQKNQEFLIEIQRRLKAQNVRSKVMFVGTGEQLYDNKKMVKELDLEDDVIYVGVVPDVYNYLQAMDVFVFPSRWEGLGMVAVEAQAIGLPVIASTFVPSVVNLTENVKFCDIDNPEKWVDNIIQVSKSRHLNAHEIIRQKGYDIVDTARFVKDLYCMR